MLNIEKYGDFKVLGKHKKKTKIVLCHTSREVEEYLTSLKFRCNGKYDKIPHYVITKKGKVLQLLPDNGYSNYFTDDTLNKTSVLVCLENLGWLDFTILVLANASDVCPTMISPTLNGRFVFNFRTI